MHHNLTTYIKDVHEHIGLYDIRVKRYYYSMWGFRYYTLTHSLSSLEIGTLPVDIQNSVWAFKCPEQMNYETAEKLKYCDHNDGMYQPVFKENLKFWFPELFSEAIRYFEKYNIQNIEFGVGLPFKCPTEKRTQKDISEYVSTCLLIMGIQTKASTIQKILWEYNTCCKFDIKRRLNPPDKVKFLQCSLKQLMFDWRRQLVNEDARFDFVPDEQFTKKLFLME